MPSDNPHSGASVAGHPIHALLGSFPVACFTLALITDLAYWKSANMQWANMSAWLLAIGIFTAALAAVAGIADFILIRRAHRLRQGWLHGLGNLLVLALALADNLVHSRDAYTSVVPLGLILSALTAALVVATSWSGWSLVYRHGVGVRPEARP